MPPAIASSVARRIVSACVLVLAWLPAASGIAQPLLKSAVNVDAGATIRAGDTFAYRLTYNCSGTSGPCLGAEVIDLLPPELQLVSTVPAGSAGNVAGIAVTPNFMGTGQTRVAFDLVDPLPAGSSGDLLLNVRFPNGTTPDGSVASNTADGVNLAATPGTFTTPPVDVTAVAEFNAELTKSLQTAPANLDMTERYRLRIRVPNDTGGLDLTSVGPVTDTLPPGTVFAGASPAADCEPGCVGTTPASVTWTSPCSLPVEPGENCDISLDATFPSATFASGSSVTNSFVADMTPLGEAVQSGVGPAAVTHPVTTFVPGPGMSLSKNISGDAPNPPTLDQAFSYELNPANTGNVTLDSPVLIDDLPVEMEVDSVSSGAWSGIAGNVLVLYETNLSGFTPLSSSPAATNATVPIPALGAGEYVTRLRWEFPDAPPDFAPISGNNRPRITGRIIDPDNFGNPVAIGDSIQNCAALSAVYTAGPTNLNRNACRSFTLSGPFVELDPAKENLSGSGPFSPGQSLSYRLRVQSDARSSDPVALDRLVAADLLPVDLLFDGWTFDDRGTGLPAPQSLEQIPNFAGTGRTLLRWTWNAASGQLPPGDEVWLVLNTTIRDGVAAGSLVNDFTLEHDAPGLDQRCSGATQADALDLDGDFDTTETLCRASASVTIASLAQLVASKTVQGSCDAGSVANSLGTLAGGAVEYRLALQNVGTVSIEDLVLVDLLPFVGDTTVVAADPRGSQWTPLLAAPVTPPAGATVYYSTSGNPCRGEVGGPTSGCDAPGWTTVAPVPISAARAIKLEFGDRALAPFDVVEFPVLMTAPADLPPGAPAFNSFAYRAERSDGLGVLAAEPLAIGIDPGACGAATLGDFVWVDLNGNGVQDDGATGLNGVAVTLFDPGADGVPASADDVQLSTAVTAAGPGGEPGWYRFPALDPGSYRVCVAPPPTFSVTAPGQGGDDALDSDADPATACAPVVVLATDEAATGIDFGLVPTGQAAVGDHVWFDRDGNGIQNEPPLDGANGVTIRLFRDDGDGLADPGSDVLVATTLTADDPLGRPGYYRFDDLAPGVDHFLQFELPATATGFTVQGVGDGSTDSDASAGDGTTALFSLASGAFETTIDAGLVTLSGPLALGNRVWLDADDDGRFEPEAGETGIDGVRLDLYADINANGEPNLGEFRATTVTSSSGGAAGLYRFDGLPAGAYIVVVPSSNFVGGGPLAGLASSTGNDPAPDPDDDIDGDDNGTDSGALLVSLPVVLAAGSEPVTEDGMDTTNLTVDFGFSASAIAQAFDYGDAPDAAPGAGPGNYETAVLDGGAFHAVGLSSAPYLGSCVDGDSGSLQSVAALADDLDAIGTIVGGCAGDDEDGVTFAGLFAPGSAATMTVTAAPGVNDCALDAWVDWNGNGVFGDTADEQIAAAQTIASGTSTVLTPTVPLGTASGTTYARFRCSNAGGLPPTGPAFDGEVEDYRISINAPPEFASGAVAALDVDEDAPATGLGSLLAVDDADAGQTLTWTVTSGPSNGVLAGFPATGASGGSGIQPSGVTYTPNPDANGPDSFEVQVSDGAATDTMTVNVAISDAPDVVSVAVDDGIYGIGDVIVATVVFDEPVDVDIGGGVPSIGVNVGGTVRQAAYASGSGTSVLSFDYTVLETDADDADGIAIAADALGLGGATITDADGDMNAADITHAGIPGSGEIVDTTRPFLALVTRSVPAAEVTNADVLVFEVMFSEAVSSLDASDFDATGATTADATAVSGGATTWQVTVAGGDLAGVDGTVGLALAGANDITDGAGNEPNPIVSPSPNQTYTLDNTAPALTSIVRQTPSDETTNADTLTFRASFDVDVDNVDAPDFTVTGSSASIAGLVVVTGARVFDVTVSGGDLAGFDGVVGLDLSTGQDITDEVGNALPTVEPATDETYTLDNTAPALTSIARQAPPEETTNADTLTFRASFDVDVDNVDAPDFTVTGSNASIAGLVAVSGARVFDVTVSGGDLAGFDGVVGLDLSTGQDITDAVGNALPTLEPAIDETYTLDNTAPAVTVDALTTTDNTPPLTGTVDDVDAAVEVTVDGQVVTATNSGDGTWSVADDILAPLAYGTFDVAVTATDGAGNSGSDATVGELVVTPDTDGDGVDDDIENGAPNSGDGNGDSIPDAEQPSVSSLPTSTGLGYMTLAVGDGCTQMQAVAAVDPDALPVDPDGNEYPFGLVAFTLPCETASVAVTYHKANAVEFLRSSYRKYGPTTPGDDATTAWYDFTEFAAVSGNTWTLDLADDRLGDDTGNDGLIVDQGGPTASVALPIPLANRWWLFLTACVLLLTGVRMLAPRRGAGGARPAQ